MKIFGTLYTYVGIAFSFLTRLPVPGSGSFVFSQKNLSRSLVAYPLVGLCLGVLSLGVVALGAALGVDTLLTAFLVLALPFLLNKFLHFDGFCDVMDAFLADKTPEQRLEILKDSRNGSFALGSAILLLLGKFLIIASLLSQGNGAVLIFAPLVSRWILVPMSFRAVYPRRTGTGLAIVGQVPRGVLISATIALVTCIFVGIWLVSGLALGGVLQAKDWVIVSVSVGTGLFAALIWMFILRAISYRAIGGVTGDVLGCLAETAEVVFLVACCLPLRIGTIWC